MHPVTRLTYSDGNHSYWLADPAGKKRRVPSVSALKKTLHQFGGERWYIGQAARAVADDWDALNALTPAEREDAIRRAAEQRIAAPRQLGTAIHDACATLWSGQPMPVADSIRGHVQAIADWWNSQRVRLIAAEALCWVDADDYGAGAAAGRLDLLVEHPTKGVGLLDLKTWQAGSAGTPRGPEWAFQLAAYADMDWLVVDDVDTPMPHVDWCGVLHVGPPGAVLHTLPKVSRAAAVDQVLTARTLKSLPKPTMIEDLP